MPAAGHLGVAQAADDLARGDRGLEDRGAAAPRRGRARREAAPRKPPRSPRPSSAPAPTARPATPSTDERTPPRPPARSAGRRVVLGVSGGIAAYKAVEVCRRLVDAGAHVAPVLTQDALRFVGALTFSALASEPARTSLFDEPDPGRADPAHAPRPGGRPRRRRARDREAARQVRGRHLRRPAHRHAARDPGPRAGRARDAHRDVGAPGGAGEPRDAARAWRARRRARAGPPRRRRRRRGPPRRTRRHRPRPPRPFSHARATSPACASLVTAGGTARADRPGALPREPLVGEDGPRRRRRRFPTRRGRDARDHRPPGTSDRTSRSSRVETAEEMHDAVARARFADCDVVVMAAAVADFRPKATARRSSRRATASPRSCSSRRPTSSASLAARKSHQLLVGFAAETRATSVSTPRRSWRRSASTSWWRTTSPSPTPGSRSTRTGWCCSTRAAAIEELPLLTKIALADVILDRIRSGCGLRSERRRRGT